jgi:signal transduction histidine kinase
VLAAAAAVLAAVLWTRMPGAPAAALTVAAAAAVALLAWRERAAPWRLVAVAGAAAALAGTLAAGVASYRLARIADRWPEVREGLVMRASARLGGELDGAVARARSLAERGATLLGAPPADVFDDLAAVIPRVGPASGVVLFDPQGRPRAWAGIQRTVLRPEGPELSAVTSPFYVWLVARRQTSGGTAVATVLLARADAVPPGAVALADGFAAATGVQLRFFAARTAPEDPDVFDYVLPGRTSDTLFAVRPLPPTQASAYADVLAGTRSAELLAALVLLACMAAVASRAPLPLGQVLLVGALALAAVGLAPLRETFGPGSLFWPDRYFLRLLGPFTASAGSVLLAGTVLFAAATALWRRGVPAFRGRVVAAVALTLAAPYLMQALARGIVPPAAGTSAEQWLTWQVALALPSAVVVLVAAALARGRAAPAPSGPAPYAAVVLAVLVAAAGLHLWEPGRAWPDWYPYLWTPALLLAIRPMRFRALLVAAAVVAGTSAALLVWGASNDGRIALAQRDLEGLGDRADPLSVALLERLVHEAAPDAPPVSAGDLYVLWRRSALGAEGYPAALAVWDTAGLRTTSLDLAQLDLPATLVQAVALEARAEGLPLVRPVMRVPGLHGVAAIPKPDGTVVTVSVGPRTRLLAPTRLARFLSRESADLEAPYEITLAPADRLLAAGGPVHWRRTGWTLLGERVLDFGAGARHAHAIVDLRDASALLQRGLLVLAVDVLVLGLLFLALETAAGRTGPALRAWWPRAHRSLRVRLSVSLALFFIVPTVGYAAWGFGRLEEEFLGARSLLLQRTLRDAAAGIDQEGRDDPDALARAARQVDAELLLSRGGSLEAASAPVLLDLGLVDVLVPGPVMRRMGWGDDLEAAAPLAAVPTPTLVGYRVTARREPGDATILAAPEFLSDRALRRREADLGVAVLVGVVLGLFAAIVLSGAAARALARPLEALRRAALDVATGAAPAVGAGDVPAELDAIRTALTQAAADVERGQRAQRVLAWGEMARQVAHEIKNPLTPIRLGVQHLLRLQAERPAEVERALPETGSRILAEIDRLDGIARSFSRFALPGAEGTPVDTVPLDAVVDDVVRLYRIGGEGPRYAHAVPAGLHALARRDELVEVLVNLCENARDAGARTVTVTAHREAGDVLLEVRDDGRGIRPEAVARVFEPRFSTTTSGSGLGLAIARRLVESWGGRIAIAETGPLGTVVRLELRAPAA